MSSQKAHAGSGERGRFPGWALLGAVMITAVMCMAVVVGVDGMVKQLGVWYGGEGVLGTFAVEERRCARAGCEWRGRFESADGRTVVNPIWSTDLQIGAAPPGSRVPMVYRDGGLYSDGTFDLAASLRLITVGLVSGGIALFLWGLVVAWLRRARGGRTRGRDPLG